MLIGVAPAAVADTGDRSSTTSCGPFQSPPAGTAHSKIRNCTIKWQKNIFDGVYWQTVSFQLLDSLTDGYCARARVQSANLGAPLYNTSECNGVWTTRTVTFNGRASWINILVNYGTSSSWFGVSGGDIYSAPSGF